MNATAYRLRELRKKRGLSQQQVANILGISRTAYNKYEHGVIQPVRKLKELTALFGVTADYILGRDGIELEDNTQKISPHAHRQVNYPTPKGGGFSALLGEKIFKFERRGSRHR